MSVTESRIVLATAPLLIVLLNFTPKHDRLIAAVAIVLAIVVGTAVLVVRHRLRRQR